MMIILSNSNLMIPWNPQHYCLLWYLLSMGGIYCLWVVSTVSAVCRDVVDSLSIFFNVGATFGPFGPAVVFTVCCGIYCPWVVSTLIGILTRTSLASWKPNIGMRLCRKEIDHPQYDSILMSICVEDLCSSTMDFWIGLDEEQKNSNRQSPY